ncbi:MAG: chromosome partitioning protein ParB [Bdellovibrio sp. CG12_big_fil_rev_8_21_14_0_65_39_13]|nr:MAG: chromosome partitioning protein ParB [Bdellovibrio sp. CG22_combo_CG10-13_8_21_14_all_39_27]PIQ60741.1 MAG: chromosome partitioning protein ParB [Bdellovibrio sp. CG12_big_fil_rev_8_21_14_0_65_39_13]PIR36365.1 MAG: chromosome partitioning protein ParB [Bdellovibrio sp. CG11_big_fil_rev_8_21_14_0_20_39_38]PJB53143.1 MAG: chromosome partitioning protein ParB [Bdellovibrio sp. CG_4_9_14_3_um_filter_39_7]
MATQVKLGKGIASLIQDTPVAAQQAAIKAKLEEKPKKEMLADGNALMIDIASIRMNSHQPRKIFKEKELEELSESIKENGIIQPLIVIKDEDGFELIAGERRLRAAKKAGLTQVPAILKRATDREKMVMAIIENVQRSDLNCIEEALAYYQLMEEFKLTQEEVAKKIGKERSTIANFLRVLKLPRVVIELIQKDLLSFGHAKVLAAIQDRDLVINLASEAAQKQLSVRETEELAKKGKSRSKTKARLTFLDDKLDQFRQKLEQTTGYHFNLKSKNNGSGAITIKFNNEAEFNDIYEFLLKK